MDASPELKDLLSNLPNGVKVVKKSEVWFFKLFGVLIYILTFGKNNTFLTQYVTTVGKTIGVPDDWEEHSPLMQLMILKHELVHVEQYRRLWIFLWVLYILVPLPVGLAWFRYYFERDAYLEQFKVAVRYNYGVLSDQVQWTADQFSSPGYAWGWPFPGSIRKWFLMKLIARA